MTDPGGIFPSDQHRHVLGHLSTPDSDYGFTTMGLIVRMQSDPVTWFQTPDQVEVYLNDLVESGDAIRNGEGWQMTVRGFERLTGPIANEPSLPSGPAVIGIAPDPAAPVGRVEFEPVAPKKRRRLFGGR